MYINYNINQMVKFMNIIMDTKPENSIIKEMCAKRKRGVSWEQIIKDLKEKK